MLVADITAFVFNAFYIVIVAISGLTAFTSSTAFATIFGTVVVATFNIFYNETVPYSHGGGWSRKINARYLHTLMVYL
jgi:hypothetical protein